jgi:hypothetical protein
MAWIFFFFFLSVVHSSKFQILYFMILVRKATISWVRMGTYDVSSTPVKLTGMLRYLFRLKHNKLNVSKQQSYRLTIWRHVSAVQQPSSGQRRT